MRLVLIFPLTFMTACVSPATAPQPLTLAAAAKPVTTPLIRTGQTIADQPLKLPQGPAEVAAAAIDIPAGAATPIHQHPWSRFVYVERGPVRIVNHDTAQTKDFPAGSVLPEVVAQWHEAQALTGPVRLIVIDLVPPGVNNTVMKPSH